MDLSIFSHSNPYSVLNSSSDQEPIAGRKRGRRTSTASTDSSISTSSSSAGPSSKKFSRTDGDYDWRGTESTRSGYSTPSSEYSEYSDSEPGYSSGDESSSPNQKALRRGKFERRQKAARRQTQRREQRAGHEQIRSLGLRALETRKARASNPDAHPISPQAKRFLHSHRDVAQVRKSMHQKPPTRSHLIPTAEQSLPQPSDHLDGYQVALPPKKVQRLIWSRFGRKWEKLSPTEFHALQTAWLVYNNNNLYVPNAVHLADAQDHSPADRINIHGSIWTKLPAKYKHLYTRNEAQLLFSENNVFRATDQNPQNYRKIPYMLKDGRAWVQISKKRFRSIVQANGDQHGLARQRYGQQTGSTKYFPTISAPSNVIQFNGRYFQQLRAPGHSRQIAAEPYGSSQRKRDEQYQRFLQHSRQSGYYPDSDSETEYSDYRTGYSSGEESDYSDYRTGYSSGDEYATLTSKAAAREKYLRGKKARKKGKQQRTQRAANRTASRQASAVDHGRASTRAQKAVARQRSSHPKHSTSHRPRESVAVLQALTTPVSLRTDVSDGYRSSEHPRVGQSYTSREGRIQLQLQLQQEAQAEALALQTQQTQETQERIRTRSANLTARRRQGNLGASENRIILAQKKARAQAQQARERRIAAEMVALTAHIPTPNPKDDGRRHYSQRQLDKENSRRRRRRQAIALRT